MNLRITPVKAFTLIAILFVLLTVSIWIKNYFQVGYLFMIVKDDAWDRAFRVINTPGIFISFMLMIPFAVAFRAGPDDYPYYTTVYVLPLILNCSLYGLLAYSIVRFAQQMRTNRKRP